MNGLTSAGGSAGGLRVVASGITQNKTGSLQMPQPVQFVLVDGDNGSGSRGAALLTPNTHCEIGTISVELNESGETMQIETSSTTYYIRYIAFA